MLTKSVGVAFCFGQETLIKTLLQQTRLDIKQGIRGHVPMKRKTLALIAALLITLLLIVSFLYMQAPQLEWSKTFTRPLRTVTYGGINYTVGHHDFGNCFVQTSDGGYAVVATLEDSYAPPHTGGIHNYTYLIIKMNSSETIQWEREVPLYREARSISQTRDEVYIIVASADVLKTDSQGNIQWSKAFGMQILCVFQASDEGYVVVGTRPPIFLQTLKEAGLSSKSTKVAI